MVTNKKPNKFFSNEEISQLMPYINGNMKFDYNVAKGLAKELSRTTNSVHKYVRNQKSIYKELGRVKRRYTKRVTNDSKVTTDKSVVNTTNIIKHGEFIIPINSFELRSDNGVTSLVLKFNKFN
jgi:hypothetical protein